LLGALVPALVGMYVGQVTREPLQERPSASHSCSACWRSAPIWSCAPSL